MTPPEPQPKPRNTVLNAASALWGFAEGTLFFFVPDVIRSYVALKHGIRAGAIASVFAAVGAACGGAIMYLWSASDPVAAREAVLALPAISETMAANAEANVGTWGWFVATLFGPLSSTPYKVYAILAPHAGAPLLMFMAASVIARLPRFLIVSLIVPLIGRALAPHLGEKRLVWVLGGFWIAFYVAFFALVPS